MEYGRDLQSWDWHVHSSSPGATGHQVNPGNGRLTDKLKKMACHIARVSAVELTVKNAIKNTKSLLGLKMSWINCGRKIIGWI